MNDITGNYGHLSNVPKKAIIDDNYTVKPRRPQGFKVKNRAP